MSATLTCPRCGLSAPARALAVCPGCLLASDDEPLPVSPPGLRLLEAIGQGGMGRVFRARHEKLERDVAVKFLPLELAADASFEARLAREARLLAQLSHPNIVPVHDFGTAADGASYLVMEYVSGGTLSARLPLDASVAVNVATSLCDALTHAHKKGIVHRDIKPENVLFDEEDRPKLADFGIARLVDDDAKGRLTSTSIVLGTPAFMAPEARAGAPAHPGMDVYALGVLLEHMSIALPPELMAVVRHARAVEPSERYASAAELGHALRAIAPALPAAPSADGDELPADEQSWQRATALMLAGATAIAIYALLVSFTPRVLEPGDELPFVVFGAERLGDGRLSTRARFETWPVLAAAGAWAVAFAAHGLLRRHWRHAALLRPAPERPLGSVRPLLRLAAVLNAIYVLGYVLESSSAHDALIYFPVIGGVLELGMVYLFWMAVLDAARRSRPLRKEPLLWAAVGLCLLPPLVSFIRLLRA
ncbi:MAG TPA: serine/threonine-protein kinase [Polyangiaceae bacterium]|nr:serine/threonine-protein kinase [Polyangiaceae bacterium]